MKTLLQTRPAEHSRPDRPAPSPYLTRRQTAELLNVSEKWLAQSGRASGPDFHKFGNHCRYHLDDIYQWARQQKVRL